MERQLQQIRDMMNAWGQETPRGALGQIAPELVGLRVKLHYEEAVSEYAAAAQSGDLESVADALADSLVVVFGTIVAHGLDVGGIMVQVFEEVMRSNDSKKGSDGKVHRRKDGKVLKGPNYSPPDIKGVLDRELGEGAW